VCQLSVTGSGTNISLAVTACPVFPIGVFPCRDETEAFDVLDPNSGTHLGLLTQTSSFTLTKQ
jgi:hypothetical protein